MNHLSDKAAHARAFGLGPARPFSKGPELGAELIALFLKGSPPPLPLDPITPFHVTQDLTPNWHEAVTLLSLDLQNVVWYSQEYWEIIKWHNDKHAEIEAARAYHQRGSSGSR